MIEEVQEIIKTKSGKPVTHSVVEFNNNVENKELPYGREK